MSAPTHNAGWNAALLAERARRLAERPNPEETVTRRRVCLCEAGATLVGLPVEDLARVAPFARAAPLANAAPTLLGVVSRSGGFALVYDLAGLIGELSADVNSGEGHLIFLRRREPVTALRVAQSLAIEDVALLSGDDILSLAVRPGIGAYGRAGDGRIVSIIDTAALLHTDAQSEPGG